MHDIQYQKRITQSDFAGIDLHHIFRENLQTEALTRRNWDMLIQVEQNGKKLLLLDKYMLITFDDMTSAK